MSGLRRGGSSPLSACFHPSTAVDDDHPPPPPLAPAISGDPSITSATCLYHTHVGVFSLSWSHHSFLRRSLLLQFYYCHSKSCYLHSPDCYRHSLPPFTFKLDVKPLTFWRKQGTKRISQRPEIWIVWDLTRARFGTGPDPDSGCYVAVVVSGELGLLVGDSPGKGIKQSPKRQIMVSRREALFGNRAYCTRARIKGKTREISIAIRVHNHDANLRISVDSRRVLQIRRLQWKFRGNAKAEVDGVTVQISWDVCEWLFGHGDKTKPGKGNAVFMFRFENPEVDRVRNDFVSRQQRKAPTTSFWTSPPPYGGPVIGWETCTDEEEEMGFGDKSWFTLLVHARRK